MKAFIISDSHDNFENIKKVKKRIVEFNPDILIHCGDFCSIRALEEFAKLNIRFYGVLGNNDEDSREILGAASKYSHVRISSGINEINLDNRKIAITHYPARAKSLASKNKFDFVFHGHTHKHENKKIGNTTVINPGEILGALNKPTFCILSNGIIGVKEL